MEQTYKYHYFYKIENLINGNFYYGIHSTNNLDDGYMGSGRRLKRAFQQYGKENFSKTILKFFKTRELASNYESEIVTEVCVHDTNCYNLRIGGDFGTTVGTILVRDKNGILYRVKPTDEDYISGQLVPISTNKVVVYDKKQNKYTLIPKEEYEKNKEKYITPGKGKVIVKDCNGVAKSVSLDDEEYLNGNLLPIWTGRHHSEETKKKMSKTSKEKGLQQGVKNSQFGTCWVTNDVENKKIKKEFLDEYISHGWKLGRKIDKNKIKRKTDMIPVEKVIKYKNDGLTWTDISKKLNITRYTLLRYRKRNKLED